MAVKHTNENKEDEVHQGKKGGKTGCGFDTTQHQSHLFNTSINKY